MPFKTESDTEVLANALRVWGPAALERLVGMYAFVAIDIESGDFIAARDPFGVKPLYLIQTDFGLIFARKFGRCSIPSNLAMFCCFHRDIC